MMKKIMVLLCVMVFSAVGVFAKTPQNNLEEALTDATARAEQQANDQLYHDTLAAVKHLRDFVANIDTKDLSGEDARKYLANFAIQEALTIQDNVIKLYAALYKSSPEKAKSLQPIINAPLMNKGVEYDLVDLIHQGLLNTLFSTKKIHGDLWIHFRLPRRDVEAVLGFCKTAKPSFTIDYKWGTLS